MQYLLRLLQTIELWSLVEVIFILGLSTTFCLLLWFKSPWVSSKWRTLGTFVLFSVLGEVAIVVSLMLDPPLNGFAYACGWLFGWALVWIAGVPILLLSFILRCLFGLWDWIRFKTKDIVSEGGRRPWGVAAVLVLAMVVYTIFLCVRPDQMWQDWGSRRYRAKPIDGIVHVQIKDENGFSDLDSRASIYHKYSVEQISSEELRLKSSDIGDRFVRKINGKWEIRSK